MIAGFGTPAHHATSVVSSVVDPGISIAVDGHSRIPHGALVALPHGSCRVSLRLRDRVRRRARRRAGGSLPRERSPAWATAKSHPGRMPASGRRCTPGSPSSIRTRTGPARTAAPVEGPRRTNSSSTPSVIPPAARAVPGGPPGTVTSGPVPRGPDIAGHPADLVADLILPPMPGRRNLSGSGPSGTP